MKTFYVKNSGRKVYGRSLSAPTSVKVRRRKKRIISPKDKKRRVGHVRPKSLPARSRFKDRSKGKMRKTKRGSKKTKKSRKSRKRATSLMNAIPLRVGIFRPHSSMSEPKNLDQSLVAQAGSAKGRRIETSFKKKENPEKIQFFSEKKFVFENLGFLKSGSKSYSKRFVNASKALLKPLEELDITFAASKNKKPTESLKKSQKASLESHRSTNKIEVASKVTVIHRRPPVEKDSRLATRTPLVKQSRKQRSEEFAKTIKEKKLRLSSFD